MRTIRLLLFILASLMTLSAAAQAIPHASVAAAGTRPKIALVLSGGGARGFAHIGALKVLREMNVPVDLVVGTSMGAVVGGAYAAGYTVESLEAFIAETSWDDVFTTKAPRQDMDFRRKDEDNRTLTRLSFGLTRDGLVFPRATFSSHVLDEVLRRIAAPSMEVDSLDDLALPFRAVATDLYSGEFVVLERTSLFNAMRASMSIPGAFAPLPLGAALLADGGLARNLPIDVARKLGADVVIAINVGTPLMSPDRLNSALDIAQQMINILTEQNVKKSLSELRASDILISPKLDELSFTDFASAAKIIARGEEAAREQTAQLRKLAIPAPQFAAAEAKRVSRLAHSREVRITEVKVQGTERTNPEILKRTLGIAPGETIADAELASRVRKLASSGDFERVNFRLLGSGIERILLVQPTEAAWGGTTLRFGVRLQSDFKSSNQFDLLAAHTVSWVNAYGGEWRNIAQIGGTRRFESEFYQPVSRGQDWFASAAIGYRARDIDIFSGEQRLMRIAFNERKAGVFFGRELGLIGEARLGFTTNRIAAETVISEEPTSSASLRFNALEAQLRIDAFDSANFPRHGYSLAGNAQRAKYPAGRLAPRSRNAIYGAWALSHGPYTLLSSAQFSKGESGGATPLGGFLSLSGTPFESVTGDRTVLGRLFGYRTIAHLPGAVGGALYAGASLELGGAASGNEQLSAGTLKRAGTLLLGADTIIGPVYFGFGRTWHGSSSAYLFVGRP